MRIEFEVAMVGLIAGSAAPIAAPIAAPNGHPTTTQHLSRTHLAPSSVPFPPSPTLSAALTPPGPPRRPYTLLYDSYDATQVSVVMPSLVPPHS